jgi:hypothetical protein
MLTANYPELANEAPKTQQTPCIRELAMTGNRSVFLKNDGSSVEIRSEIDEFLENMKKGSANGGQGRLIFALDATASRQPTWDLACSLQGQMFQEVTSIGELKVQLVYYRGLSECKASRWISESSRLLRLMERLDCRAGRTQIEKILVHAKRETRILPVSAVVFVGDALEETTDKLFPEAHELGRLKVPAFMFQEGDAPEVEQAFRGIARLSGGAYSRFDRGAARQLSELLKAVSLFALGGLAALEGRNDAGSVRLIAQLR